MNATLASPPMRSRMTSADSSDLSALFVSWQRDGDQRAREELVTRFLPLARSLAKRYTGANEPIEDLVQVASLALIKAINRFDPERGLAFTSFAVPTILGELKRYFRDYGWSVHVPRGAQDRALRLERATRDLAGDSARTPSVSQLAQYLEWDVSDVLDALEANSAHHSSSLDAPAKNEEADGDSLVDLLGDIDARYDLVDERVSVASVMHQLPLKERQVLSLRFIDGLTQTQIAGQIGVSQMQVSRILRSALDRLRDLIEADPAAAHARV